MILLGERSMVKGSLEKWKTGCGVGAAFQAKEILAWSRTAEVWDYMEYGTKPADGRWRGIWPEHFGKRTASKSRRNFIARWGVWDLSWPCVFYISWKLDFFFFFLKGENGAIGALWERCSMYDGQKKIKYSQGRKKYCSWKTPLSHRHYFWKLRQGGLNGARLPREDCVLLPLLVCVLCSSASGSGYRLEPGGQQWSQGNSTHRREIRRGCELL